MEFPGLVHLCNFWLWASDQLTSRLWSWAKSVCCRKSISSLSFCPTMMWQTFSETSGLGLENIETQILKFGVRTKISGFKQAGTHGYIFFWGGGEFGDFTQNSPPPCNNQIPRAFLGMQVFNLRPTCNGNPLKFWILDYHHKIDPACHWILRTGIFYLSFPWGPRTPPNVQVQKGPNTNFVSSRPLLKLYSNNILFYVLFY
jgi:hypothetical protein